MNTLGERQDNLNKKIDLNNELFLDEQVERESIKRKKMT